MKKNNYEKRMNTGERTVNKTFETGNCWGRFVVRFAKCMGAQRLFKGIHDCAFHAYVVSFLIYDYILAQ